MADILRTIAGLGEESEVRRLLRETDWGRSPLGPPDGWPPELVTAFSMAGSSAFPMFIAWGADLRFLHRELTHSPRRQGESVVRRQVSRKEILVPTQ